VPKNIMDPQPLVKLLVIQPTPFCNINCDYCYLPYRNSKKRLSLHMLKQTIEKVFASELVGERLSIVWHAGEPLVLPIGFYEEMFQAIESLSVATEKITHSMQSNGMLINDEWCKFIKEHNINLGLSIDGPALIHDAHRKTRRGMGTHEQVMKGVKTLQKNSVDFHVIAVITEQSLDHPDEIFGFFLDNGIHRIGFNIEEIEGANQTSTLSIDSIDERIKNFLHRLYELQKSVQGTVRIREFDNAYRAIAQSPDTDAPGICIRNDQVMPYSIISIDCDGNFSTFSPELLGLKSSIYGDFCFGNIMTDDLLGIVQLDKFNRVLGHIQAGVRLCAETCEYFSLCGGGSPSNKYFENGTFDSAETMYCRYAIKMPLDIVLADLEDALDINSGLATVAG
jgi:uncharacterized protein